MAFQEAQLADQVQYQPDNNVADLKLFFPDIADSNFNPDQTFQVVLDSDPDP